MLNKTKKNELQKILLTSSYFFFSKFTDISVRDAKETFMLKTAKVAGIVDKNTQTPKFSTPHANNIAGG
jgi:hypothetical protein